MGVGCRGGWGSLPEHHLIEWIAHGINRWSPWQWVLPPGATPNIFDNMQNIVYPGLRRLAQQSGHILVDPHLSSWRSRSTKGGQGGSQKIKTPKDNQKIKKSKVQMAMQTGNPPLFPSLPLFHPLVALAPPHPLSPLGSNPCWLAGPLNTHDLSITSPWCSRVQPMPHA